MKRTTLRPLAALVLSALAASASAAGFQAWEQNGSGLGVSYAGAAAVADNASTIYYNPAGMTLLPGRNLSLGMAGVRSSYEYTAANGVSSGGDAGGWLGLPNAYLSWQLDSRWFAGLGISSPFALRTDYEAGWAGAAQALKSDISTINVNPSLAYRYSDSVSLGFGLNYQTADVELSKAAGRLKADDSAWGWNAGALFTLSPNMRLGVSYRAGIEHKLGDATGVATLKLPDTLLFSVWQQLTERWEAMGSLSLTRWSNFKQLNVAGGLENYNYNDAWRFAWGAAYKIDDAWKGRFGLSYDRTPVTDAERSPRLPENSRLGLSAGLQWRPARGMALDFGYAYQYQRDPSISGGGLNGRYANDAHILGVQYSQGF